MIDHNITPFMRTLVSETAGKFRCAYCREDLQEDMKAVRSMKNRSAYASRRRDLLCHLRESGISCDNGASDAQLEALIASAPTREELQLQLMEQLHRIYRSFPTSDNYMERLVRRLGDPEFRDDPVRLAIVKQFVKYTGYNTAPILALAKSIYSLPGDDTEAVLSVLDERIFEVLDRKLSRDERRKYALLKLADDLAFGRFRTNGKTRVDLYMFAFAFHMTAGTGDARTDVEKNLFSDFYQDNLLRYITEDYSSNFKKYESEPTGEGINYKNFAEVIYLYYLRRNDLDTRQKVKKANLMVEKCHQQVLKLAQSGTGTSAREELQITDDYRWLLEEGFWHLSEKELPGFIAGHFHIPVEFGNKSKVTAQWEEKAALNHYLDLLDELTDLVQTQPMARRMEEILDNGEAGREILGDGAFMALVERMDQMLRLRLPSAAAALANSLKQEGNERDGLRILDFDASLTTALEEVKESAKLAQVGSKASLTLSQTLRASAEAVDAQDADARRRKLQLRNAAACIQNLKKILDEIRSAHGALETELNRARSNFRERADVLRTVSGARADFMTVHGNLLAASRKLTAVLDALDRGEAAIRRSLEEMETALTTMPASMNRGQTEAVPAPAVSAETLAGYRAAVDTQWCGEYRSALLRLRDQDLAVLQNVIQELLTARELNWNDYLSRPDTAKQIAAAREELASFERISRTALIAIHYHLFLRDNLGERMSMPEIIGEFSRLVDPVLEESRYQRISEKNLFDMMAVFFLYYRINLDEQL